MDYKINWIVENGESLRHIRFKDGTEYYFDDQNNIHRPNNRPAYIGSDGTKQYLTRNLLNRTNGPAIVTKTGAREFFLDGVDFTEKNYWEEMKRRDPSTVRSVTMDELKKLVGFDFKIIDDNDIDEIDESIFPTTLLTNW